MLSFTASLTFPLNVCFAFEAGTKLLNADEVRDVNSGAVRKSGILRGFKILEDVQNLIVAGLFGR
jgi:hypothetical protein